MRKELRWARDDTSLIDRRFTEPLPLFDGIDPIRR